MRNWTKRKLVVLAAGALSVMVNVGCLRTAPADPETGGSGGGENTGGSGGSGGSGAGPTTCDTKELVTGAPFAPTSGPAARQWKQVVATADVVMATTDTGLHRSTDGGETWSFLDGSPFTGQQVAAMAALGAEVFVSTGGAIFRTSDGGETWQDTSTADCGAVHHLSVRDDALFALASGQPFRWNTGKATWDAIQHADLGFDVMESSGQYLYANSMYVPGVYRLDLETPGAEWTAVPDLPEWGYKAFAFVGDESFAANSTQVFRSSDGGATWKALPSGAPEDVRDFLVKGDAIFAAASSGLELSTDQGATWMKTEMGPFLSGFALASDGTHVFSASDLLRRTTGAEGAWEDIHVLADSVWMLSGTETSVLSASQAGSFRTTDGGATWEPLVLPDQQSVSFKAPAILRDGKVFMLGYQSILVSGDDGASFESFPLFPIDNGFVNLIASIDAGIVVGASKGAGSGCADAQDITSTLYLTTDGGATWTEMANGFPITFTDCYGKDYTPMVTELVQVKGALLAATYHDGAYRSEDGGLSWAPLALPEDVGVVAGFGQVADVVLASTDLGLVLRSLDSGKTWEKTGFGPAPVSSFVAAGATVFASVGLDAASGGGVFHSSDLGATWSPVDAGFDARVRSLAVQGGSLFAGTMDQSTWAVPLGCAP